MTTDTAPPLRDMTRCVSALIMGAMETGNDSSRVAEIAAEWYALNPGVRRLWVYETAETGRDIHVVVALAPVCDSDDMSPIWLAKGNGWQSQLQMLIGRRVQLDCFDENTDTVPCEGVPHGAGTCLASIVWRDLSL